MFDILFSLYTLRDSNPGPTDEESVALPTELRVHCLLFEVPGGFEPPYTVLQTAD